MKSQLILPFFILFLISCIKKTETPMEEPETMINTPLTEGLPENFTGCDGYLYYSNTLNAPVFAFFSDPRKNLTAAFNHVDNFQTKMISNISVGEVKCNGQVAQAKKSGSSGFFYSGFGNGNFSSREVIWSIDGNGSFEGFSVSLPRGTPILRSSELPSWRGSSKELIVDLGRVAGEFDSVVAVLHYGLARIEKVTGSPQKHIVFTAAEIDETFEDVTSGELTINAFNYSHFTKKNKLYIFECGSSASRNVQISH